MENLSLFKDTDMQKETMRISYSALSLFLECPYRYKRKYIDGLRDEKSTKTLILGRIMHAVLKDFMDNKYSGAKSFENLVYDIEKRWPDNLFPNELERAKTMAKNFISSDYAQVKPFALEQSFKASYKNLVLTGRIDRADRLGDGGIEIIDYKTTDTIFEEDHISNDLQLAFLNLASKTLFKQPASKVTYMFLETGMAKSRTVDQSVVERACDQIGLIAERISNEKIYAPKKNKYCFHCLFKYDCGIG